MPLRDVVRYLELSRLNIFVWTGAWVYKLCMGHFT